MHTIAKITPADYPDLLAAVDACVPQRELARRYDCAIGVVSAAPLESLIRLRVSLWEKGGH